MEISNGDIDLIVSRIEEFERKQHRQFFWGLIIGTIINLIVAYSVRKR